MNRFLLTILTLLLLFSINFSAPFAGAIVYPNEGNPAAAAADGDIGVNVNTSYAVAHSVADTVDCSGNGIVTVENSVGDFLGTTYYSVIRGVVNFDTSFLGANAVITSAVFSIKTTNVHFDYTGSDYIRLVKNTISAGNTYSTGDFNSFQTLALANDVYVSTLWTDQYANFTLNSTGRNAINKTGVTHFALRCGLDISNTQPTLGTDESFTDKGGTVVFFYGSETAGTASDPKLLINFTR